MKFPRLLISCLVFGVALPACKSNKVDEFGFPEDDPGLFSLERRDKRADWWDRKRKGWAKREDEKWDRMFNRMSGGP